jgi:hypothetical protein
MISVKRALLATSDHTTYVTIGHLTSQYNGIIALYCVIPMPSACLKSPPFDSPVACLNSFLLPFSETPPAHPLWLDAATTNPSLCTIHNRYCLPYTIPCTQCCRYPIHTVSAPYHTLLRRHPLYIHNFKAPPPPCHQKSKQSLPTPPRPTHDPTLLSTADISWIMNVDSDRHDMYMNTYVTEHQLHPGHEHGHPPPSAGGSSSSNKQGTSTEAAFKCDFCTKSFTRKVSLSGIGLRPCT